MLWRNEYVYMQTLLKQLKRTVMYDHIELEGEIS